MALLAVLLMGAAAVGAGAAVLRLLDVDRGRDPVEHVIWSFVLGFGALGWGVFFLALAGALAPALILGLCFLCAFGLVFLPRSTAWPGPIVFTPTSLALIAGIALALTFDLLEGLSPPADADSLAYHFALPKAFLGAGQLLFVPRASDGAVPLLQQMTYAVALSLGGERAMTLWAMLTGWSAAGATFCVARRYTGTIWALVAALAFLTVPAVIFGGGSGQVEIRNAAFVLVAVMAAVAARVDGNVRQAALAGIAAGFYAASKYPGLLFVAACALPLLFQRRWFAASLAYGAAVLVAGGQWYAWNAWNTGDPVFPMLHPWLAYHDGVAWDTAQHLYYQSIYERAEKPVPATLLFLVLYPFQATFSTIPQFDSKLVGFGPLALLLLPAALLGLWFRRSAACRSPLVWIALTCAVAYALWFFLGPSLRVRFHLPIYPLLLVCLLVATERAVRVVPAIGPPAAAALGLALLFQLTAHAVFSLNYARHVLAGESRDAFLTRNVTLYSGVRWANDHLGPEDRVAVFHREMNYLLDISYFYINSPLDGRVDVRLGSAEAATLWRQLRAQAVTHVLTDSQVVVKEEGPGVGAALGAFERHGCLTTLAEIPSQTITSRTLSGGSGTASLAAILQLTPATCAFEQRRP